MPTVPHRLVLDTNAWLDLLVFEDPRLAAIREALGAGRAIALSNTACREEWHRVLAYPVLALHPEERQRLQAAFDAQAVLDETPHDLGVPLPRCSDPDDQKFLELALASSAQCLLTRDKALLKLNRRTHRAGLFDILVPEAWAALEGGRKSQISNR